jgi:hypothetical protein
VKIKNIIILTLLISIVSVGCGSTKVKASLVDLYAQVFDELMVQDTGLNGNIDFIAIDFTTTKGLSSEEKNKVLELFKKYKVDVKDASLEDLKKQGLFDDKDLYIEKGILLKIDEFKKYSDKDIVLDASKYRSGTGAIGMEFEFKLKGDLWKLIKSRGTWIS